MDVKSINIDDIGLSVRASNCLHRVGVHTVGDMLTYTEESLQEIRNLGKKTLAEILQKIEDYKKHSEEAGFPDSTYPASAPLPEMPEDFTAWSVSDEGREFILSWLREQDAGITELELLSAKAYNRLLLHQYLKLDQIIFLSAEDLMNIPWMDLTSAEEIVRMCWLYLKDHEADILECLKKKKDKASEIKEDSLRCFLYSKEKHDRILQYVQANDCDVEYTGLSVRAKNVFKKNGLTKVSEIIFVTKTEMQAFKGIGSGSMKEIQAFIDNYLVKHETRIKAFCSGDDSALLDKNTLKDIILDTYNRIGFAGLSLKELRAAAELPEQISDEMLKAVLGSLLAEGVLEYVDFRCYRIYPKFSDYVASCSKMDDRNKDILRRRVQGETLESIASEYDMTRERVRQITNKCMSNIKGWFRADTGMEWFDEDYYRYFYETYAVKKKDAGEWLGISRDIFSYLELTGAEKGKKDLEEAVDDYHHLGLGFRLKIKNYLNRNKLYLDGKWIDKNRADLEEYVVRKYCRENISYEEFINIYNNFLKEEGIPYDKDIYYTDSVWRTRENKLSGSRYLLWKQNRQIRYYDIDARDYTELLDTLNLDAYENIEYSTAKFMADHPAVMEKYDIRDQYELHNLFRKIIPEGSYHAFHCNRTPMVEFGKFDRDGALMDLLIENAPISQPDFAELVCQEYGYEPGTVMGSYLSSLDSYYHQGMYTIDQKAMTTDHKAALETVLTEDFYYIDEIREKYAAVVPDADPEEINPYNLKNMGFSVLSRYVYRNYSSLDAYFRDILTREDITDITGYRRRFAYVQAFSVTITSLKNEREVLEFEPNQIIHFRKLEKGGITKEDLQSFCDEVNDFTEDGTYFSVQSIKKDGFESELFELGFSDWFYASLLSADERFAYATMFGNIILYKGNERITIKSFEETLIRQHGSIDVYDLMTEMEENYGCRIPDHSDLIYKVAGTDVYYDKYMDRLYANTGVFNRELDETEGL